MKVLFEFSILTSLPLSCSDFSGDALRSSFPQGLQDSEIIFAKRDYFNCALAAIEAPPHVAMGSLPAGYSAWEVLPIHDKVEESSIIYRILDGGDGCWTESAASRTGMHSIWQYDEEGAGYFALRGNVLLILDIDSNTYIAVEG